MEKRLLEIAARKMEIRSMLNDPAQKPDLDKIEKELKALDAEDAELRKKMQIADGINSNTIPATPVKKPEEKKSSMLESVEYRQAFMDFARTGVMAAEFRAVALTSGNAAVIPPTVLNKIIEKVESYGNILPLVSYTNYPAGLSIPTSELTSPATFTTDADLAANGAAVGGKTTGSVVFGAYPMVKALGLSFAAQVQALSAFEASLANNVSQAMAKGLENAIINGSGTGAPKGILTTTPAKTVSLAATLAYKDMINIKKAIPAAYRTGAVMVMNDSTFWDFMGITDTNGQPVARMNMGIDGEPIYQVMGTRVVPTDWISDLESAAAGATVAFIAQLDKYIVNTAYNIDLVTYIEQATRNKVYQSFALLDGKMADTNGLVFINKHSA